MCGIFGVVGQQSVAVDDFVGLAEANKHRGNLAFGYLQGWWGDGGWETAVSRYPQPFTAKLAKLADGANMALGHIRAPTGSQSSHIADVHPFTSNGIYLAHNGLLLNHLQFPAWRLFPNSAVDSQDILGGIQAQLGQGASTAEAICATVSQLEGQQACWLWSQADSSLFLWRVMSPIYYSFWRRASAATATEFVFSSGREQPTLAGRGEWAAKLLPEGKLFRLDPLTLSLESVAAFSYYSPYRI